MECFNEVTTFYSFFLLQFLMIITMNLTLSLCEPTRLTFKEGESVELLFSYDHEEGISVKLRIDNKPPFYGSAHDGEIGLSENQIARFVVNVEHSQPRDDIPYHRFQVRVSIDRVSREDAGTYVCDIYRKGRRVNDYTQKIIVDVEYPIGKAFCSQERNTIDTSSKVWALLKCSALVGSQPGLIQCYQSGRRMPPFTRPLQNGTHLLQTIWMEKTMRIYCCSSTFEIDKDRCDCNDFMWDPVTITVARSNINPCPSNLPGKTMMLTPAGNERQHSTEPLYLNSGEGIEKEYVNHKQKCSFICFEDLSTIVIITNTVCLIILTILMYFRPRCSNSCPTVDVSPEVVSTSNDTVTEIKAEKRGRHKNE